MLSELSKTCVCCMREGKPEVVPFVTTKPSWPGVVDGKWDAHLMYVCDHAYFRKGVAARATEAEAIESLKRMYPQIDT